MNFRIVFFIFLIFTLKSPVEHKTQRRQIFGWEVLLCEVMWRLQVQSQLHVNERILTTAKHMYPVRVNGVRTIYPSGLNKGFCVGSRVRHETPKEGREMHRPKHRSYNNEDEDNSLNTLSDKKRKMLKEKEFIEKENERTPQTKQNKKKTNKKNKTITNRKWK